MRLITDPHEPLKSSAQNASNRTDWSQPKLVWICSALFIILSLIACSRSDAQTNSAPPPTASGTPPRSAVQSPSAPDLEVGREAQFISLLHARDGQVFHLAELKRILTFHESLNANLQRMLSTSSIPDYKGVISKEQKRVDQTISALSKIGTLLEKQNAVKAFDDDFPVTLASRLPSDIRLRLRTGGEPPPDIFSAISTNRSLIQNFGESLSVEDRTYINRYDTILTNVESRFKSQLAVPKAIDDLPGNFLEYAGAASWENLTDDEINEAMSRYKTTLSEAMQVLGNSVDIASTRDFISQKMSEISNDIQTEYKGSAKNFDEFESGIVRTATLTFGNAVGSSSFTYLLVVFAAVFVMIMLFPVLYKKFDSSVATNLIKAEFLLQLSTVFVLTSAIIILGIGQFIDKQQLPVLLAGISGYVLGQLGKA